MISDIRKAIFKRDSNKCYYCGSKKQLQLDHVLPKSKYCLNGVHNLITSCWKCNFKKNTHVLSDKKLNEIFTYLYQANSVFNKETIKMYNKRLYEYFINQKEHRKRKNKPPRWKSLDTYYRHISAKLAIDG